MRYLGLDLGTKTLGVAMSDITGTIANSYGIIRYEDSDYATAITEITKIIQKEEVSKIVLGFPKNMNNSIGPRAKITLHFKEQLEHSTGLEVIMQDERLTSIQANNYMLAADLSRKKRKAKIDSLAANIILQSYLDKRKE